MPTGPSGDSPDPATTAHPDAPGPGAGQPFPLEDPTTLMDASALQLIILPAGHHRRAVRPLPRPGRAVARHRARRRCRTSPARSSKAPSPSSGASTRRSASSRSSARSSSASSSPSSRRADVADTAIFGLDLGWRTGLAFLVGAACSMASGHHRHVHQRQGERPNRGGRPAEPRRGGPGRDARRGRLRASSSSPCRCSASTASSPSSAGCPAARRPTTRRS